MEPISIRAAERAGEVCSGSVVLEYPWMSLSSALIVDEGDDD